MLKLEVARRRILLGSLRWSVSKFDQNRYPMRFIGFQSANVVIMLCLKVTSEAAPVLAQTGRPILPFIEKVQI